MNVNRRQTAEALSNFVSRMSVTPGTRVEWRPEDDEESGLPSWISCVHVLGVPDVRMAHWTAAKAGWAANLTSELLQNCINEKSGKLPSYEIVVPENWLVMIANAMKPSQLFAASPSFERHSISSPFSRTFYYNYPGRDLIEF